MATDSWYTILIFFVKPSGIYSADKHKILLHYTKGLLDFSLASKGLRGIFLSKSIIFPFETGRPKEHNESIIDHITILIKQAETCSNEDVYTINVCK